jgi:hypothetical protein
MANIQISGLTPVTSAASGDVFALDQSAGSLSKKITTANLAAALVTTINVTSAGALMDSEVVNLAQVKAFDSADYATAAQGTTADNALPKAGGAMTGAITTTSTFDGRYVATDGAKLDTITVADITANTAKVGITPTQASDITANNAKITYPSADSTKLSGIEALADVTDTTNVTAAGALMDSELTSIADVKALNQSLVIGAAPVLDATNMINIPSSGISINDSIGGATNNTVLYANLVGDLGSNSKFTFDGGSLNFTGNSSTSVTCTSFGYYAGNGNTSNENTSIGNIANQSSSGLRKTAVGHNAGNGSSGNEGTFLGADSGKSSGGNRNNYIGYRCGMNRGTGGSNNAQGDYSLFAGGILGGIQNTAMGSSSQNSIVGSYNTSIGGSTLSLASGSNNTAIGYAAGQSLVASDVLALGYQAGKSNTQSNRTIIGHSNLPVFAGEVAAAAALPAAGVNGVYLYWDSNDNTIKARP